MPDNNRWTTYGDFGEGPYNVERVPPPDVSWLPAMRAARGAQAVWGAARQLPQSWLNDPAAGLAAAYRMMPALPLGIGGANEVMNNPAVREWELKRWRDRVGSTSNLMNYWGNQMHGAGYDAGQQMHQSGQDLRQQWLGPNPLTPLPGAPY